MSRQTRTFRRRRWIVQPRYQWNVAAGFAFFIVLFAVVTLGLMYYALWSTLRIFQLTQDVIFVAVFQTAAWMVTIEVLVVIPFVVFLGILLTHRMVGPLSRVQKALEEITHGNFDVHVQLREGDVLLDLGNTINRMAAALRRGRS